MEEKFKIVLPDTNMILEYDPNVTEKKLYIVWTDGIKGSYSVLTLEDIEIFLTFLHYIF